MSERKNLDAPGYNKSPRDKSPVIRNSHACEFNEEGRDFGVLILEAEARYGRGQHPCHETYAD